ncbi:MULTISPECIES: hypothetical protein [Fusobacterium]|uniref:hypothetical protein n=1 Tax=Fusobacterium TaxID=848 RepID=UPI0014773081|nr:MULTISPECIES: hypothetical protein [Fusobacterium]NME35874.1 hypothetical protein [Fusobacterium sp. FSA-380-WT-3A]
MAQVDLIIKTDEEVKKEFNSICEKLYWDIEVLGNRKFLDRASKELKGADEQLLVLKIVEQYIKENKLNDLYQLLTRKETNYY